MSEIFDELLKEFSSKTYLGKIVAIVKSFKNGNITGEQADKLADYLSIDPKDLKMVYEYGYSNSIDIFKQPNITLSQFSSSNATQLEKIVLLALELKRKNIVSDDLDRYCSIENIDIEDVKSIYSKLEIEIKKLRRAKQEVEKVNNSMDEKDLEYSYTMLHKYILYLFEYITPSFAFILYCNEADKRFSANENIAEYIGMLSDSVKIEEKISNAEKGYINLFVSTTSSTKTELIEILNSDLGRIFAFNDEILGGILKTLKSFRKTIEPEVRGLIAIGNQISQYLKENDTDLGSMGMEFIKGAGLGHMAAVALGPAGIALAMGSLYMNGQKKSKETEEQFDNLILSWESHYDTLHNKKLPIYYKQCRELSDNIAKQYIANFRQAEAIARDQNRLKQYSAYLQKQLIFFVNDSKQKNMQKEIDLIRNSILRKED